MKLNPNSWKEINLVIKQTDHEKNGREIERVKEKAC